MIYRLAKRSISQSTINCGRYKPLPIKKLLELSQGRYRDDASFDPEFEVNRIAVEQKQEWTEPANRKQAERLHKNEQKRRQLIQDFNESREQVQQFLLNSTTKGVAATNENKQQQQESEISINKMKLSADLMHDYRLKCDLMRRQYLQEFELAKRKQQMDAEGNRSGKDAMFNGSSVQDDTAAADKQTKEQEAKDTDEAIRLLNRINWKLLKQQQHEARLLQMKSERLESLTRLYNAASSFITIDTLDSEIDKCLRRVVTHETRLGHDDMRKVLQEQQDMTREKMLYDALTGLTADGPGVEELQARRHKEKLRFQQANQTSTA